MIYETDLHEGSMLHVEGEITLGLFCCELEGAVLATEGRRGEGSEAVKSCCSHPAITDGLCV